MMSGPKVVTDEAGGKLIIETEFRTRMLTIANRGSVIAYLKMDKSEEELTVENGHPLDPGEKMVVGFGSAPNSIGPEMELVVRAICASGEQTTLVAQAIH